MRFQEFQVNAEVSAYIEANRGDMTRARFTHELLKQYVKQLSQGEQFSNDNSTKHRS